MSSEKDTLFDKFIDRFCEAAGISTKKGISVAAKALGMTRQSLQNYKSRGRLPEKQAYKFACDTKVSARWLLYGEGDKYSDTEALSRAAGDYHIRDPELMLIIDRLLESPAIKREFFEKMSEGNYSIGGQPMQRGFTPFEQEYLDKLLIILRYKDSGTRSAITQNIDTFLRVPSEEMPPAGETPQKKRKTGSEG